jgi:gliding motility-associatede transport system auxiliary component
MATKKTDKNQKQKQAVVRIVIMAAILICINILASYFHSGLDLTKEKRFTLSPATKRLLGKMQEVAVVDVYLKGKFPAELQRLQEAIRERLRSFQDIAGTKIIVHFIDPLEGKSEAEQKQIVHDLSMRGVRMLQLSSQSDEEYSMKVFFPYAVVQYNGKEEPVMLLEDPPNKSAAEKISYAEAMLEYKFAAAINELSQGTRKRIAYITGNGEDLGIKSFDMLASLPRYYDLDTVDLGHVLHISLAYDAIIISQPTIPFTGPQKLKIDQYVMHGGHVLWAINNLQASLDSLAKSAQFIAMEYGLNLDDILYKYGVRINNNLLEDMQCLQLSRTTEGGTPEKHDWVFFPRLNPTSEHPIVRNMDFIRGAFTNTIDTIRSPGLTKTILLQSSKYSRAAGSPARVSLSIMSYPMKEEMFPKSYLPVAVLVEGKFHSVYQNLLAPEYIRLLDSLKEPFKPICDSDNRMIVTSVGDIFSNDYTVKDGPLQMGYYKWTGEFFANRNFLLNCMEYLTDRSGILEARSKEVKLRMLDSGRTRDEKTKWQVVNVSIPIALVLIFSSCYFFFRKRKYETKQNVTKTLS